MQSFFERGGIIMFDLPNLTLTTDLVARLEDRWACCASGGPSEPLAVVFLSPESDADFIQLMRRVEAWVAERALGAITFKLRGRGQIQARPYGVRLEPQPAD